MRSPATLSARRRDRTQNMLFPAEYSAAGASRREDVPRRSFGRDPSVSDHQSFPRAVEGRFPTLISHRNGGSLSAGLPSLIAPRRSPWQDLRRRGESSGR